MLIEVSCDRILRFEIRISRKVFVERGSNANKAKETRKRVGESVCSMDPGSVQAKSLTESPLANTPARNKWKRRERWFYSVENGRGNLIGLREQAPSAAGSCRRLKLSRRSRFRGFHSSRIVSRVKPLATVCRRGVVEKKQLFLSKIMERPR